MGAHVAHPGDDQLRTQAPRRLGKDLHAHRQRHDRQRGQLRIGAGHGPPERVVDAGSDPAGGRRGAARRATGRARRPRSSPAAGPPGAGRRGRPARCRRWPGGSAPSCAGGRRRRRPPRRRERRPVRRPPGAQRLPGARRLPGGRRRPGARRRPGGAATAGGAACGAPAAVGAAAGRSCASVSAGRRSIGQVVLSATRAGAAGRRRRRRQIVDGARGAPREQIAQVHGNVVGGEHAGEVQELHHGRAPLDVGGDRHRRPAAQDVLDERGQVSPWADLHEHARAVVVQRLDCLPEPHRARPVVDQQLMDLGDIVRIWRGGGAGPHHVGGRADRHPGKHRPQLLRVGCEQRRVDRPVIRQDLTHDALVGGDLPRAGGGRALTGEHDLMGAVVHRHIQLAAGGVRDPARVLRIGAERQQHGVGHVVARGGLGVGVIEPQAELRQALVGVQRQRAAHHCR